MAVSLIGLAVIPSLTVKLEPSRTLPRLTVNFSMQGNSGRIIEMEVTSKLEAMLGQIDGVKNIRSTSSNNIGSVTIELDKHVSMDVVRFEASTIIRQTWPNLPSSVSYPTIYINRPDDQSERAFLIYNINATVPPIVIQQYAEEYIKPVLAQMPDIYRIDVTGATPMEWILEYDINQLDGLGITINNISEAINSYNRTDALGMVLHEDEGADKRYIRLSITSDKKNTSKGFHPEDIFLPDKEGNMIRLDKLITMSHREALPSSYYRINGLNSIYLQIYATENANQLNLSKSVKEEIAKIEQLLPNGYEMHIGYDASERIDNELNKIYFRTVLTILILLVFVFITTLNVRYMALIILSLFFNISIAFIFYYIVGLEIQKYSLAGITISLSLVIDNTIIIADHYMRNRNMKAFLSILAATLTTIGALGMIFFLNEELRLDLQDFAAVVIINLIVSLAVSLLFVPALIENMKIRKKGLRLNFKKIRYSPKRIVVYFNKLYFFIINFMQRFRVVALVILVFAFGLPVFMLPDKLEGESKWVEKYNKISTSQKFKEKIRPVIEKSLGGTLRLFVQKVYSSSYRTTSNEVSISITSSMPNGTTIQQINHLVQQMESYLSQFKELRQFQTRIYSPRQANIQVYFTKEVENTGFPYQLKSNVITQAMQLGGGSWAVYGLLDQGFSNNVSEYAGSMQVKMSGYNYDDLYSHAETFRQRLINRTVRIKDVIISSQYSMYKDDYKEFVFSLNKERMAAENILPYELYASLRPVFERNRQIGQVIGDEQVEYLKLSSKQSRLYDIWSLSNMSRSLNDKHYKTGDLTTIEVTQTPQNIVKENQQYILTLQYEYVGSSLQGNNILTEELKNFNKELPMGYTAENQRNTYVWGQKDNKQYLLLGLIILIIFFMTSILFNSLKQPLAIIFVIPVSYIGVFLTFYLFKLNFDQGGFASFILLCAITVNASIYLINEYNQILKRKPNMKFIHAYIKSWNIKIVPIFLTIISTILGFIPFMVGLGKEAFWFPLAVGTIGGLIMSFFGIFFYLPLFLLKKKRKSKV